MSKELPNNPKQTEEVDLIVFFNLIGNAINKVFGFFASILKSIFSVIIYTIKTVVQNWKIIAGVVLIAFVCGKILERTKPSVYSSEMLVRPYFESKFQLITNISYFNALIANENYDALKTIFKIDDEVVKEVKGFYIEPGPETENDRILQYEKFIAKIDSVRAQDISFDDYIENRSIYSGNLYLVRAEAYKKDIFKELESGLNSSFSNEYSIKKMKKRDSINAIQRENILANLKQVDSLQNIYINVMKDESQNASKQIKLGDISLSQDKSSTREYELLNKEIQLRNSLRQLDEQKVEEDVYFDIISSFQKVGNRVSKLSEKYSLIFPVLAFLLLILYFIAGKIIRFSLKYEG